MTLVEVSQHAYKYFIYQDYSVIGISKKPDVSIFVLKIGCVWVWIHVKIITHDLN